MRKCEYHPNMDLRQSNSTICAYRQWSKEQLEEALTRLMLLHGCEDPRCRAMFR
jgi:hypothetical protein